MSISYSLVVRFQRLVDFSTRHQSGQMLEFPPDVDISDDANAIVRSKIGMKYRGSSSLQWPKKQFSVEMWTDDSVDWTNHTSREDVALLGMPEESDWVFYSKLLDFPYHAVCTFPIQFLF